MSLRFLDSFDHYTSVLQKWTSQSGSPSIVAGAARTGAAGLLHLGAAGQWVSLTLDSQGTWIIGVAFRMAGPPTASPCNIISTYDGATVQGLVRVNNADSTLSLLVGAGVVATSSKALLANTYYYIELKHIIANVGGTLEVRVNGEVWITFNGDTQATVNPTANIIRISGFGNAPQSHFDDIYILDGTGGAPNNDYWGDTQIECLVPDGAGFYTAWATLVGAATHWQSVSEIPPDDDISYVADNTVGNNDSYTFGNLSVVSAVISGIQVLIRAREDAAGGPTVKRLYRNGGADNLGVGVALGLTYTYIREIMETDPIAAAAWTVATINSAEFGAQVGA